MDIAWPSGRLDLLAALRTSQVTDNKVSPKSPRLRLDLLINRRIRMTTFKAILLGTAALAIITPSGIAHFRLLEPASWIQENQLGDPQKLGPCGGTSADPGKPTDAITNVTGGEKLHIRIQETVFHPGFYRVALA